MLNGAIGFVIGAWFGFAVMAVITYSRDDDHE